MAEIKYQYAYDENQHLISIADVTKENRNDHQYICIGCGNPLLPRAIGSKSRRPHFYHKQVVDCSGETYLHKLTKQIFKERFDKAEHFEISYPVQKECSAKDCALRNVQCKKENYTTTIDLKKYYDSCQEEMPISGFVADLLLTNSSNPDIPPILVEVCVSHPCEPEKRNSGVKIIELKIRSEENITELLSDNHLIEERGWEYEHKKGGTVEFISFKRTLKELIQVPVIRYVLGDDDEHQAGYCTSLDCKMAQYKIHDESKHELNIVGVETTYAAHIALQWLYDKYYIRRCTVCKFYYATEYEDNPICRLSKKYGTAMFPSMKDAERCHNFRIEKHNWITHPMITEVKEMSPNRKEPFNVIVAGCSGFQDYDLFMKKCDHYLSSKMSTNDVYVLSGTSLYTSGMIARYCYERHIIVESFNAEWARYGSEAARICTDNMLKHANAAIVFWDGKSRHTQYLIDSARRKGIRVAVVKVDASVGPQMIHYMMQRKDAP